MGGTRHADAPAAGVGRSSWHGGRTPACGHAGCNGVCLHGAGAAPTRDGGRRARPGASAPNLRVVLTAWPPADDTRAVSAATRPTRDPCDRAHNVHEPGSGLLVNAAALLRAGGSARPRRYPPHQMTSRGVAFDSAYDALHEAQAALAREGVTDLGAHTARAAGGDWQQRAAAARLAGGAVALRAVVDRNRRAWDCGPMPVWERGGGTR